jgi:hypothetical protein
MWFGKGYEGFLRIVKQVLPVTGRCCVARDENIVMSYLSVRWEQGAGSFSQAAFGTVAGDGIADFLCGGKANPNTAMIWVFARLNDYSALRAVTALADK